MGVGYGVDSCRHLGDVDFGNDDRDVNRPLLQVAGSLPAETVYTLRLHFASISDASSKENSMDIKAILQALEGAGIQITTQNVAPLVGQLVQLGVAAAEKGISDLSHKAGVQDVTKAQ